MPSMKKKWKEPELPWSLQDEIGARNEGRGQKRRLSAATSRKQKRKEARQQKKAKPIRIFERYSLVSASQLPPATIPTDRAPFPCIHATHFPPASPRSTLYAIHAHSCDLCSVGSG